jgi:hypothetical protein
VSWSPHEAESGPVFVLYPDIFFLVVLVVERAAGGGGAALADDGSADTCGKGCDAGVRTESNGLRSVDVIAGDLQIDAVYATQEHNEFWTAVNNGVNPFDALMNAAWIDKDAILIPKFVDCRATTVRVSCV